MAIDENIEQGVKKKWNGKKIAGIAAVVGGAAALGAYVAIAQPQLPQFFEETTQVVDTHGHDYEDQGGVVEIEVEAYHWGYNPSVIEVEQGDTVRLYISLEGDEHMDGDHHDGDAGEHHDEDEMGMAEHSFSILSENRKSYMFGVNENLYDGKTAVVEFTADKAGEFPFACLVYCGISEDGSEGHHTMNGLLRVLPEH